MWYLVKGEKNSSIICLTVDKVFELIELNKAGKKIGNITDYVQVEEPKNEVEYSNVDDQDDLTRFDNKFNKKKNNRNKPRNKKKVNPNASGGNQNNPQKAGAPKGDNNKGPEGAANPNKKPNNQRRNKNFKKKNNPNSGPGNSPAAPKKPTE